MTLQQAGVVLLDCVHNTPAATPRGYPYVAIPQMKNGIIDFSEARRISRSDFLEWTRKAKPRQHDVVLSRRTNPGVTAAVGDNCEFALGQNLVLLRADGHHVRPEFLKWLVKGPCWWQQIEKFLNVGAVFDSLRCADVPNFTLPIPPMGDQDAIVAVLGSIEDMIGLNRRMAGTLEAMARALFKSWFVDFDPVHARAGCRPTGLSDDLAALFPNSFSNDGLPEGWLETPLSSLFSIYSGGTPKTTVSEYWSEEVPWFSIADTPSPGSVFVINTEKSISNVGLESSAAQLVEAGTTIITARGTVGNLAMAGVAMTFNQSCYGLRGIGDVGDCFVYLGAQHMIARLKSMSHGSVFNTITRDTFAALSLPFPFSPVLLAFENIVQPLFDRLQALAVGVQTISALRDTLLPKLISGELRIADAEQRVAAA